jgi:hypothetical protein
MACLPAVLAGQAEAVMISRMRQRGDFRSNDSMASTIVMSDIR